MVLQGCISCWVAASVHVHMVVQFGLEPRLGMKKRIAAGVQLDPGIHLGITVHFRGPLPSFSSAFAIVARQLLALQIVSMFGIGKSSEDFWGGMFVVRGIVGSAGVYWCSMFT